MGKTFIKVFILLMLSIMQAAECSADTFKGKIVNAETGEQEKILLLLEDETGTLAI